MPHRRPVLCVALAALLATITTGCPQTSGSAPPRSSVPTHSDEPSSPRLRFDAGRRAVAEAAAARERADTAGALAALERAARLLPPQPGMARRVAGALAQAGRVREALAALEPLVAMAAVVDLEGDPDLVAVRALDAFPDFERRRRAAFATVARAEPAFRLGDDQRDFVPEGIAYAPGSTSFFLSSVRKRRIARVRSGEETVRFADLAASGFGSPLGLAVDSGRALLWVAVSSLAEAEQPPGSALGRAGLVALDLATGALRATHSTPEASPASDHSTPEASPASDTATAPNDLVIAVDGRVFVSDPQRPAVWVLPAGAADGAALEPFLDAGAVVSPNGLALAGDGRTLFVADYALGLLRVDLSTRAVTALGPPGGAPSLVGIDGLVRHGEDLVAIQNGIAPPRILRLRLATGGNRIAAVEVLEMAREDWDEPTLGVVVAGALHYVANSHWPRFDSEHRLADPESLSPPLVLRLPLEER